MICYPSGGKAALEVNAVIDVDAVKNWISRSFTPATEENEPVLSDEAKPSKDREHHGPFRMLHCPKVRFYPRIK